MTKNTQPDAFDRFLAAFAQTGSHRKAAEGAGLTLEAIASRRETDAEFEQRYKLARKTRRMLVEDAVLEEALGVEHKDAINGRVTIVRNLKTLHRLAEREDVLDPERPQVAIQNNVTQQAANDPAVLAYAQRQEAALREIIAKARGERRPAQVIDATIVEPVALPASSTDPDSDLV